VAGIWDLEVYVKACALADALHASVLGWSKVDTWTVGVQAIRAADSIGANLAEAGGRRTDGDRARFLFIARGSGLELQHWLERAAARGLTCPDNANERAREISRMLNGMTRAWSPSA
jgi:four helix bundle protein